jgi:hypothetical protein
VFTNWFQNCGFDICYPSSFTVTDSYGNIWKELELGSGAKFRILLSMVLNPKRRFTKYLLVKSTGLRTPEVDKQLNYCWNWVDKGRFSYSFFGY